MSTAVQRRRGSTVAHSTFTGLEGEISVDTTKKTSVVHDGILAGGFVLAAQHLAQTWVPSQVFANTENFFGSVAAGAPVIKFLSTPGAGFSTLDFNSNGTPDLNFIRKYNSTPFQLEIGGSGGIDVVTDTNSNETSADIRFLTNGIRGSGTQVLLATFRDNGMVDLTGRTTIVPKVNTEALRITTFSLTGAASNKMVELSGTLNTTGSPTIIDLNLGVVAYGASTKLIDLRLASATIFSVYHNGIIDVAAGSVFHWLGRSTITSPSDGVIRLSNNVQTDFNRLQFGGTTGAFPAIGRLNNQLEIFGADGVSESGLFIYNNKPTATDFERLNIIWSASDAIIWTQVGTTGAGIARDLVLGADATARLRISVGGAISWGGGVGVLAANGSLTWGGGVGVLNTDGSLTIDNDLLIVDASAGVVYVAANLIQADRGLSALGFFNAAPATQQTVTVLVDNMAATTDPDMQPIAGALYSTDAPIIRDNIKNLTLKLEELQTALANYGLILL